MISVKGLSSVARGLPIVIAALLAGCATAQPGPPAAVREGQPVSIQASQTAGYDYLVVISDVPNLGFDPSDQAARDRAALAQLKNQCDAPQIIGETIVKADGFFESSEPRRYEIKVRC